MKRFFAEWEKQDAILVAFPHARSDWSAYLSEAQEVFSNIIFEVANVEKCIVLVDPSFSENLEVWSSEGLESEAISSVYEILVDFWKKQNRDEERQKIVLKNIKWVVIPTNDTWARDFGGICVEVQRGGKRSTRVLDFGFNGWGLKFASNQDNVITRKLAKLGILKEVKTKDMILEGGSIDSNGAGLLLTTSECLLESIPVDFSRQVVKGNRNPALNREQIEEKLKKYLGIKSILWLNHGYLRGDDTDSHIDTLARFINEKTIIYVKCEDKEDEHYKELKLMEKELQLYAKQYKLDLVALPMATPLYYENERLPASYANFLIINGAILLPTYGDAQKDTEAINILQKICKKHKIIPIDCQVLVRQHGSLHCVTMQFAKGAISLV